MKALAHSFGGVLGMMLALDSTALAWSPTQPAYRQELLSLVAEDIRIEQEAAASMDDSSARLAGLHDRHRDRLRRLLAKFGWPGWPVAGADGQQAAIKLFQRECGDVDLIQQAVAAVRQAIARSHASSRELALLIDCQRVGQQRPQVYGTLYVTMADGRLLRFPVEDPAQIEARRRMAGLGPLREQEEALGLLFPRRPIAKEVVHSAYFQTLLQTTRGLNSVRFPRLRYIYIHSRDDPRAPIGERKALEGLDILPISPTER